MRIRILAETFFPDAPGGLSRVAWDVAKAMARRGHEVGLLAGDRAAQSRAGGLREERIDGVHVVRYPKPAMSPLDPFRDIKQIHDAAAALREMVGRNPCDVLHCHSIFMAHAALRAAPELPVVQTVHSPAIQELAYNWSHNGVVGTLTSLFGKRRVRYLEGQAMTAAMRRHALSRFTVEQMLREYPATPGDYETIPHWVDPTWFRSISKQEARDQLGWPRHEPVLFTVRLLRRRYGLDTAIEAIAPLAKANRCRFLIAGAGEERGRLENRIRALGAQQTVRMLGRLSDEDLRLAYQAADVFILPTRALECFGLIILEALACGLPVIGTSVGAIPESLGAILPDWIVSPDDPEALRRKVEDVLEGRLRPPPEPELLAYVRRHFGEPQIADRYEQMFLSAMN